MNMAPMVMRTSARPFAAYVAAPTPFAGLSAEATFVVIEISRYAWLSNAHLRVAGDPRNHIISNSLMPHPHFGRTSGWNACIWRLLELTRVCRAFLWPWLTPLRIRWGRYPGRPVDTQAVGWQPQVGNVRFLRDRRERSTKAGTSLPLNLPGSE